MSSSRKTTGFSSLLSLFYVRQVVMWLLFFTSTFQSPNNTIVLIRPAISVLSFLSFFYPVLNPNSPKRIPIRSFSRAVGVVKWSSETSRMLQVWFLKGKGGRGPCFGRLWPESSKGKWAGSDLDTYIKGFLSSNTNHQLNEYVDHFMNDEYFIKSWKLSLWTQI